MPQISDYHHLDKVSALLDENPETPKILRKGAVTPQNMFKRNLETICAGRPYSYIYTKFQLDRVKSVGGDNRKRRGLQTDGRREA